MEFSGSRSHISRQSDSDSGPPPAPSASRRASSIALAASLEGQPISLADASPFVSLAGSTADIFHLDPLEESPLEDTEAEVEENPLPLDAALASAGAPSAPVVNAQTERGGDEKSAAITPVVLTGEHAAPMTPRTRARNPMQDIVSMITTGSAHKLAPSSEIPTSAVLGGAAIGGAALAGAGIIKARSLGTEAAVDQEPVAAPSTKSPLADSQGKAKEGVTVVEGTTAPQEPEMGAVAAAGAAGERHIAAVDPAPVSAVDLKPSGITGAIPTVVPEPTGSTAGTAGSVVELTPPSSQPTSLSNGADLADADLLMLQQERGGDEFALSHATPAVGGKVVTLGEAKVLPGYTAAEVPATGETESVLGYSAPSENYSTVSVAGSIVSNVATVGEGAEVADLAETVGASNPASEIPHSLTSTTVQGGATTTTSGMSPDEVAVVLGKDPTGVQSKSLFFGADAADAALKKLQLNESVLPAEAAPSVHPAPTALAPLAEGGEEGSQVSVPHMLPGVVSDINPGKASTQASSAASAAGGGGEGEESPAVGVLTQGMAVEPNGDTTVPSDLHEIPASKDILLSPATTLISSEPAKEGIEPDKEAPDAGTTQEESMAGEGGQFGTAPIVPPVMNTGQQSTAAADSLPPVAKAVQAPVAATVAASEAAVSPITAQSDTLEVPTVTQVRCCLSLPGNFSHNG